VKVGSDERGRENESLERVQRKGDKDERRRRETWQP